MSDITSKKIKGFITGGLRKIPAFFLQCFYQPAGYFRYWRHYRRAGGTLKQADISIVKPFSSASVAICAGYPTKLDDFFVSQLRALVQAGFDVLLVSNRRLDTEKMTAYSPYLCTVIERPNIGRDFGAYRDGYLYLEQIEYLEKTEELLFINDTIIFPLFDAATFWKQLRALPYAVTGPYENYAHGRHLQSFMLLLRHGAQTHPAVRTFWNDYRPMDTRQHTIKKGEIGFSRALGQAGIRWGALCDGCFLIDTIPAQFDSEWLLGALELLNLPEPAQLFELPVERQWSFLRRELGVRHTTTNPSHSVGLFLAVIQVMPFLKKDLLSRGSAKPTDLWWLKNITPEKRRLVLDVLKEKGLAVERSFWEWLITDFLQIK